MSIDKGRIEKFESAHEDIVFNAIRETSSNYFETIELIKTTATKLGQPQVIIPNAGITINNKIVELSQIFKRAGISMFYSLSENYDVVSSSVLGDAIINDLIRELTKAVEKLNEYAKKMEDIVKQKNDKLLSVQNERMNRNFFTKIKYLFVKEEPLDLSLTDSEKELLDNLLQEYKNIDLKIFNYNMEQNLVSALVKEIIKHKYSASTVPGLLDECIIPDLKKLGFEHIISQLQVALVKEYEKNTDNHVTITEDNKYLYVPDFERNEKLKHTKIEENINDVLSEAEKLHEHNYQVLKDFPSIQQEEYMHEEEMENTSISR